MNYREGMVQPAWKRPIPAWVYIALLVWVAVLLVFGVAVAILSL